MSRRRECSASASSRSSARPSESTPAVGKESGLPLIQCNSCVQERVIELRAWTDRNYGRVFFKCPRYETGEQARCGFYYWQHEYFAKLVELERITVHPEAQEGCSSEDGDSRRPNVAGNTKLEEKMDVLVRTVMLLVGVVFVGVVLIGSRFLMK
ncbi:unnamed protein product [Urochloa humidicola]